MSDKKNKTDSIYQEIEEVKSKLLTIDPNSPPELINEIQDKLNVIIKLNSARTKTTNIFAGISLLFAIAAIFIGILIIQNYRYQGQLEERLDNQIKNYNIKDSLFDKYIGVDKEGNYSTYSVNGKLQSYKDLLKRTENLEKKNSKLIQDISKIEDKFNNLKYDYDFIVQTYQIKVTKTKVGTTIYTNINSKKLEDCYGKNQAAAKKAIKQFKSISDSLSHLAPLGKGEKNKFKSENK